VPPITVDSRIWLASASGDGMVAIHDLTRIVANTQSSQTAGLVSTSAPFRSLKGHQRSVTSVAWGPDPRVPRLATASMDGKVLIWDVEQEKVLNTLAGHLGKVYCVVWSLTEPNCLFSGSEDQTVWKWDLENLPLQTKTPGLIIFFFFFFPILFEF